MTVIESIKARADIAEVAEALGYVVRGKRARHPEGNTFSVSLDRERNLFFRHSTCEGGDVFDLVKVTQNSCFKDALRWLANFKGVDLKQQNQKAVRRSRRQRHQAQVVAKDLADFCWRIAQYLRAIRNNIYDAFNKAEYLYRGSERVGDSSASEWRGQRRRLTLANELDGFITRLEVLSAAELIALRDRLEGAVAA